jgi:hypothetical protein
MRKIKSIFRLLVTMLFAVVLFIGALGEQLSQTSSTYADEKIAWFQIQSIETNWSVLVISPKQRIVDRLRVSLQRFDTICKFTKEKTERAAFKDLLWNPAQEAIMTLESYCLVWWQTWSHHNNYHGDVAITVAEAIKIITKIAAMDENISFDEFGWYPGYLPYNDILPNARYVSYVIYADARWYLDGITASKLFGRHELKWLTPMKKNQIIRLFHNVGKTIDEHPIIEKSGTYILRNDFAELVADAFAKELEDYSFMYGNNHIIYRWLLVQLWGKTIQQQQQFLQKVITTFEQLDQEVVGWKYNLHLPWLLSFLKSL